MAIMITKSTLRKASIACLATTSTIALGYYLLNTKPLTQLALERQSEILKHHQERIENWWEAEVRNIENDLNNPEIISPSLLILQAKRQTRSRLKSPLSITLSTALERNSLNRKSVSLLTRGGIVVFSTASERIGMYQPLKNTTTSLELGQLKTTPLNFFTDSDTGLPSISVALPISDSEQKRLGFLAIDLDLSRINGLLHSESPKVSNPASKASAPIEAYLAARTTLEHITHIAPPTASIPATGSKPYQFEPLNSLGIQKALDGQAGQGLYLNTKSQPTIGVYGYLPTFRTALMVESLQHSVYLPARRRASYIFYSGVFISLALFCCSVFVPASLTDYKNA